MSVAAGIAAITSAIPSLTPDRVAIGVGAIAVLLATYVACAKPADVRRTDLRVHHRDLPARRGRPEPRCRPWVSAGGDAGADRDRGRRRAPRPARLRLQVDRDDRHRGDLQRCAMGDHLPLEVIIFPHRAIVAPMVNYISSLHRQRPDLTLTVILPEIIVRRWRHRIPHNQTAARLRHALRPLPRDRCDQRPVPPAQLAAILGRCRPAG
jgi:hypothetical protein